MILLDSQAAVGDLLDDSRLGPAARHMIAGSAAVHVSAASVWELTIKSTLGKLDLPEGLRGVPRVRPARSVDRLIIAQAAADGMTLITADRVLLGLGRDYVVDAGV